MDSSTTASSAKELSQQYATEEENLSHDVSHKLAAPDVKDHLPITVKELHPDDRAFLLYNFLSQSECQYYMDNGVRLGMEELTYNKSYRNNDRCVVLSEEMSKQLFERIKPYIKPIQVLKNDYKQVGLGMKLEGLWEPVGLNPCWRLCRYAPGGHFGPHHDGPFVKNDNERSLKTLNIYLNGDFEGGTTNFLDERAPDHKDELGRFTADKEFVKIKIKPEAGLALVFNHYMLHEGEPLQSNVKWLMRSDIMFERKIPPEISPKETEAIRLYNAASQLEMAGKLKEAGRMYADAARLWPEIEMTQKHL